MRKAYPLWSFLLLFAENSALALSVRRWVAETAASDAFHYTIRLSRDPSAWYPYVLAGGILALLLLRFGPKGMTGVLSPLLLMWGTLLLTANFGTLLADLLLFCWTLCRVLQRGRCKKLFPVPETRGLWAAGLLSVCVTLWTCMVQFQAYDSLFFAYQDWGEYAENYLLLADGRLPLKAFLARAGHFNLLPNLIMSALLKIFRTPKTIFAVSSLLLGSLPLLCYALARARRLPPGIGVGCALLAALNPVILNQGLSFFYGYHPILFLGPLLVLFFLFRARGSRTGMAVTVILSLLVQETAAVFWAGYGLGLLAEKRWKIAFPVMAGALLWFFAAGRVLMPWALGGGEYAQNFHYANLGDSLTAILLSPLLRPAAFWGNVLQKQSIFFALTLLLPVLPLIGLSRKALVTILPLFAGVVMQESGDLKNPVMQYGYEITVFLLVSAIPGRPVPGDKLKKLLSASLVMSFCTLFFWGRAPIGKFSARPIFRRPDQTALLRFISAHLPPGGRLVTTGRLRTHWMFERETASLKTDFQPGDTVVLDFGETMEPCRMFRQKLLADPRSTAVASRNFGSQCMIWRIRQEENGRVLPPFIRMIPTAEFERIGLPMRQNNDNFSVRMALTPRQTPVLLVRKNKAVEYDLEIVLETFARGKHFRERICYGLGVHPAWYGDTGEVFLLEIPIPKPERGTVTLCPTER